MTGACITPLTLFPPRASDAAAAVERDLSVLLALSAVVVIIVGALVLWFGLRYRESAARARPEGLPSRRVEAAWISVLILIATALFVLGAQSLLAPRDRTARGRPIYVVGKQWMWKVQHPSGRREINELHLAMGEPVRLVLASQDVIHSFFVPAFRLKQDAVPGMYTSLSFTPTREGEYHLFCAEYCGSYHSRMVGRVTVMRPPAYEHWLSAGAEHDDPRPIPALSRRGGEAFTRLGCGACHGRESTPKAPRLDGIFGGVTRTRTGELVAVDENYVRESLLRPNARVVAGYGPTSDMPSYQGEVSEEEIASIIEFLRSIRNGWPAEGPPHE